MAKVTGSLRLSVSTTGLRESVDSVVAAIEASPELLERLLESLLGSIVLGDDLSGLVRCEAIKGAAPRAGVLHGMGVLPDQRYLELVSAVVAQGDAHISSFSHGWPILSVVGRTPTVAEAGGEAIAPGGGQIA